MTSEGRAIKVLEAEACEVEELIAEGGCRERAQTILAGIAEVYQPEQLVGRTIVTVAISSREK
jgi:tRNA-binding EMAP/Myf-like protein